MKWGRGTQWRPPLSEGIEQMKELVTCRGWSHATLREYISVDLSLRVRGDLSRQPWEPEQCSRILCYTAPSGDTERPLAQNCSHPTPLRVSTRLRWRAWVPGSRKEGWPPETVCSQHGAENFSVALRSSDHRHDDERTVNLKSKGLSKREATSVSLRSQSK